MSAAYIHSPGPSPRIEAVDISSGDHTFGAGPVRALYVGGAGDLVIKARDNSGSVTLASVPAGRLIPVMVETVAMTGTTATSIVGLY